MLDDLLKVVTPETLVYAIKKNPLVVQKALHKFETYTAFAQALTDKQQIAISSNLYKVKDFFKSDVGKTATNEFVEQFIRYTNPKT